MAYAKKKMRDFVADCGPLVANVRASVAARGAEVAAARGSVAKMGGGDIAHRQLQGLQRHRERLQ